MQFEYYATIVKIVDGDTVDVDVDLGWNVVIRGSARRIRLHGVDAPESRNRNVEGKAHGLLAKKFVQEKLKVGGVYKLRTKEKGKFGRYLGDFQIGDKWLCAELVANQLAVPYTGQNKKEIAKAHEVNRLLLVKKGLL